VFDRLRSQLNLQSAMLVVVLVLAAVGAYTFQERHKVDEQAMSLDDDRRMVREDLEASRAERTRMADALAQKNQELERTMEDIKSADVGAVEPPKLSSRRQAIDLSSELIAFAAGANLALTGFDSIKTTVEMGTDELPGINYTLVVAGPSAPLLNMLRVVAEVTSARINTLDLERVPDELAQWVMSLDVDVVFAEDG
jgi:hypothetical protein